MTGRSDSGFSMLEMLVVVLVMGIIAAFAIPQAYQALKAYRLHNDAAGVAASMNVARFRAASQYAPYRIHIDTAANTYDLERLCGVTTSLVDANCTSAYQPRSTPLIEGGLQPLSFGDTFTTTNPGGAGKCPPPPPESLSACGGTTDFYFNTRGMPIDSSGNPLANGGSAIYVKSPTGLTDAIVVTVGGEIKTYNWGKVTGAWYAR